MAVGLNVKTKPLEQVRDSVPVGEVVGGDLVRFNFFLPRAELRLLKNEAFALDVSVADLVRETLLARRRAQADMGRRAQADMGSGGYAVRRIDTQDGAGDAGEALPDAGS